MNAKTLIRSYTKEELTERLRKPTCLFSREEIESELDRREDLSRQTMGKSHS